MMARLLHHLRRNDAGSMLIEFALLAPVFMLMLVGVFQAGMAYQNYNAIRSLSADAARYVMIEYQKNNNVSREEIRAVVMAMGRESPYLLQAEQLDVDVEYADTSRISGTREIDIEIAYAPSDYLNVPALDFLTLTYSRPVFVVAPSHP